MQTETKRLTAKEYFDLLEKTSLEGGFPAMNELKSACIYRTEDGKACAVGIILPDKYWKPEMNEWHFQRASHQMKFEEWIPEGLSVEDLCGIQSIHDGNAHRCREDGKTWDHEAFMNKLRNHPVFQGF